MSNQFLEPDRAAQPVWSQPNNMVMLNPTNSGVIGDAGGGGVVCGFAGGFGAAGCSCWLGGDGSCGSVGNVSGVGGGVGGTRQPNLLLNQDDNKIKHSYRSSFVPSSNRTTGTNVIGRPIELSLNIVG